MKARFLLMALLLAWPGRELFATPHEGNVRGWGAVVSPAGDCKFKVNKGELTITVPGSTEKIHDLCIEGPENSQAEETFTAPRILRKANGDFSVEVKIERDENALKDDDEKPGHGYTGAGLVVFADDENYVRMERATLYGGDAKPYTIFEMRVDGQVQGLSSTGDFPTDEGKPTWLRLERHGNKMIGGMSQDGINWKWGDAMDLNAEAWHSGAVKVGVDAVSTSALDFKPVYSGLKVTTSGTDGEGKASSGGK